MRTIVIALMLAVASAAVEPQTTEGARQPTDDLGLFERTAAFRLPSGEGAAGAGRPSALSGRRDGKLQQDLPDRRAAAGASGVAAAAALTIEGPSWEPQHPTSPSAATA